MLYFFSGSDRAKAREALNRALEKSAKKARVVRVTDANSLEDLRAALAGGGLFAQTRVVVLDGTFANGEMRSVVENALPAIKKSGEQFLILEEKPDAATRKLIEKHAEKSERFDAQKSADRGSGIFAMANALRKGDKKALWVGYQRELLSGKAPEAVHGVLFWGAKQALLAARDARDVRRFKELVAHLAELPHEARRKGVELEYALERFVLSGA